MLIQPSFTCTLHRMGNLSKLKRKNVFRGFVGSFSKNRKLRHVCGWICTIVASREWEKQLNCLHCLHSRLLFFRLFLNIFRSLIPILLLLYLDCVKSILSANETTTRNNIEYIENINFCLLLDCWCWCVTNRTQMRAVKEQNRAEAIDEILKRNSKRQIRS